MDTETISAFRFRLHFVLVVSASQDAGSYATSRQNNSGCIWVAIPVDWVILHWYARGADGRSNGWSVYGHVTSQFSRMGSLPHFLTHGAPLCTLRARELHYNYHRLKVEFLILL